MEIKEYVTFLLENYVEIQNDIEQLQFELNSFSKISGDDIIESLSFSTGGFDDRVKTNTVSDKTSKIDLVYRQVCDRLNREKLEEITKMLKVSEYEMSRLNFCIGRFTPEVENLVSELYVKKVSRAKICDNHSISVSTLKRLKQKAIENIASNMSRY